MAQDERKAPFPWFGGKSKAAPAVWEALGDVPHYVEPFAGSLAVLLNRPHEANRPYHSETVNDLDCLLCNAWRAVRLSPDATAEAASWPVSEADLLARHIALVKWRAECRERVTGDPDYHDPRMAGWWLWGVASWIGSGWCAGTGPWTSIDGRLARQGGGVSSKRPSLGDNGRGVNHAGLREPGLGEPHPDCMPKLRRWLGLLSARLRHVRVCCGDWRRVLTTGAAWTLPVRQGDGPCGVFLDPPYADTAGREKGLYSEDSLSVAHEAREWAVRHGGSPKWRIAFAGFEGEHGDAFKAAGWREVEWYAKGWLTGGMANQSEGGGQQDRERLWLSPHCVRPAAEKTLFDHLEG